MASKKRKRKSTSALDTSKNKKQILRIGIVQNGRIVEEKLIKERGDISIGRGADNNFLIPSKDLPKHFKVFEETKSGYIMNFVKGMDARVAIDNKLFTLNQILEQGDYIKKGRDFFKLDLLHCSRGKLVIGEITLLFHFVTPPPELPKPQLPHVMWGVSAIFKTWLGKGFASSMFASLLMAGTAIAVMLHYYDPNWKPDSEETKTLIRKAIARHDEKIEDKKTEDSLDKKAADGEGEGEGEEEKQEKVKTKPTKKSSSKDDSGPTTEKNISKKIDSDKDLKAAGNVKLDADDLKGIDKIDTGSLENIGKVDVPKGPINIASSDMQGLKNINVGSSVTEDSVDAECTGDSCVASTHAKFKPGSHTADNAYGGTTGNTGGKKVPSGGGGGNSLPTGADNVKVDVMVNTDKVMLPMNDVGKIMIGTVMTGKTDIGMAGMEPKSMSKKIKATGSASGLIPSGAPLGVRKMMGSVKYRVIRCFQKAGQKGLVSSGRKSVRISANISGGKFKVTGVSGFTQSYFKSCVQRIRKSTKKDKDKKYSKSWTFTMHLIAKPSS
ncbi:MAG: hypothetical protein ACQES9_03975 [Myxococcota bacterium]